MKTPVINIENKVVGEVDLPAGVFGAKWNPVLVQQVLLAQLANRRRPWAHAKDRSEVRGGGKKPWRQKGTGRARHGSSRSPIWVGGGKAHGPNKERDYSQKVNKKMLRGAIASILSKKLKDGELRLVEGLTVAEPKTKILAGVLRPILGISPRATRFDALLIPKSGEKNLFRAGRNLDKAKVLAPVALNVYDLVNHKNLFLDTDALAVIERQHSPRKIQVKGQK